MKVQQISFTFTLSSIFPGTFQDDIDNPYMSSQSKTLVGKGVGKKYDMSGGQNVNKDHYTEYMSA